MKYSKFPLIWFASHQLILIVFNVWYILFHVFENRNDYALAGFALGFTLHSMLFVSWSALAWEACSCVWPFTVFIGFLGWAFSLCLIVSLDHWSMFIFMIPSLLLPVVIAWFFWALAKKEREIRKSAPKNQNGTPKKKLSLIKS